MGCHRWCIAQVLIIGMGARLSSGFRNAHFRLQGFQQLVRLGDWLVELWTLSRFRARAKLVACTSEACICELAVVLVMNASVSLSVRTLVIGHRNILNIGDHKQHVLLKILITRSSIL